MGETEGLFESLPAGVAIILVAGIFIAALNIVLFFRIWGMTSDVFRMRILLERLMDERKSQQDTSNIKNKQSAKPSTEA